MSIKDVIVICDPREGWQVEYGEKLREHFGKTGITYNWRGLLSELNLRTLLLTRCALTAESAAAHGVTYLTLKEAVAQYNAAIPYTRWQSGPPPCVGEWNASCGHDERVRRWWNGSRWSKDWWPFESGTAVANKYARIVTENERRILWRGLSREPIVLDNLDK